MDGGRVQRKAVQTNNKGFSVTQNVSKSIQTSNTERWTLQHYGIIPNVAEFRALQLCWWRHHCSWTHLQHNDEQQYWGWGDLAVLQTTIRTVTGQFSAPFLCFSTRSWMSIASTTWTWGSWGEKVWLSPPQVCSLWSPQILCYAGPITRGHLFFFFFYNHSWTISDPQLYIP